MKKMVTHKIAVISDIHGNADALNYVLGKLKEETLELTIVLGDLLTYGCQPNEVIDMLTAYKNNHSCVFIKGNHEEFYFDKGGDKNYKMPDFVRESVDWTASAIEGKQLESVFVWEESFIFKNIFFAHANPYEYGNWEYVDNDDQHYRSFNVLSAKGYIAGVFGHSHRAKVKQYNCSGSVVSTEESAIDIKKDFITIINTGSVGQPRGTGLSYLLISYSDNKVVAEIKRFSIDLANSECLINESGISNNAKEKLLIYLRS